MEKQNHTSHIAQKGITLIALIITIIVMLILVGVTINVALNGGLFQKAEEAKTQTQKESEQEELQLAVIAALNDDLEISDANAIKNNLSDGWTITGPENGVYTCISPKANKFTVGEIDKKITYAGISNGETKEPNIYGVGYTTGGYTTGEYTYYCLENNVIFIKPSSSHAAVDQATGYTKNGNDIITTLGTTVTLSEDFQTISMIGMVAQRNENDVYNYNPVKSEIHDIYINAFYKNEETGYIFNTGIVKGGVKETIYSMDLRDSGDELNSWIYIEEMQDVGITIVEGSEGKQISYKGKIYNLIEK